MLPAFDRWKYTEANSLTDQHIKSAFKKADILYFSAKKKNSALRRFITCEELGCWVPLVRFFTAVGIKPAQLEPVFGRLTKSTKNSLPIRHPDQLKHIDLDDTQAFLSLSGLLGKRIRVLEQKEHSHIHEFVFEVGAPAEIHYPEKPASGEE